jgi:hypothetical protein
MDSEILEKINLRRLYKIKGKLDSIETGTWFKIFITKNSGKKKKTFVFSCGNSVINAELSQLAKKTILRFWFEISCKEFSGKWVTFLNIKKYEVCPVNEEKLKKAAAQQALFEEDSYKKSIVNNPNENF